MGIWWIFLLIFLAIIFLIFFFRNFNLEEFGKIYNEKIKTININQEILIKNEKKDLEAYNEESYENDQSNDDDEENDDESNDDDENEIYENDENEIYGSEMTDTVPFDEVEIEEFFRCENPYIGKGSKGERECRRILKKYFKMPFKSCRPHFLANPDTGVEFELDCYESSLRLAVEFQGRQHYHFTPFFHKTIKDFEKQQLYDKIKAGLCERLGIYLIRVPYSIPFRNIKAFILENLPPHLKGKSKRSRR